MRNKQKAIFSVCDPLTEICMYVSYTPDLEQRKRNFFAPAEMQDGGQRAAWLRELRDAGGYPLVKVLELIEGGPMNGRLASHIARMRRQGEASLNRMVGARSEPYTGAHSVTQSGGSAEAPRPRGRPKDSDALRKAKFYIGVLRGQLDRMGVSYPAPETVLLPGTTETCA